MFLAWKWKKNNIRVQHSFNTAEMTRKHARLQTKTAKSSYTRVNNFRATSEEEEEKNNKWSESKGSEKKKYIKRNEREASLRAIAVCV